jgi:hypothetical protein
VPCAAPRVHGCGVLFFYTQIVLDENMIVSGVEYIKDVLFLCMSGTVPPAGVAAKSKAQSVKFDGETYSDLGNALAFDVNYKAQTNDNSWQTAWERRTLLSTIVVLAIAQRDELRKEQSKPPIDTKRIVTKVVAKDFNINQIGKSQPRFLDLVEEVHSIFAQLKTVVDEITELEKYVPPAAAPPPAAAAGELSADERAVFLTVMTALGPWGRGNEVKDSIEMLVGFEKDMTDVIGTRVLPMALIRLRALVALEAGAKAALPDAAADDPEALLKKIQDTEEQLKAQKVIVDEYAATKLRLQQNIYELKTWDEVEPTIEKLVKMNDEVNKNVPGVFNVNKTVSLQGWRQEFDKLQEQLVAYAKTQLEVQKALYDKSSWDEVLPEIKTLKNMCDVFVQQTPKVFNESNTLDIVKWRADYDSLVLLRDAFWESTSAVFKSSHKFEEMDWSAEYKAVHQHFDACDKNQANIIRILKPTTLHEILPTLEALVTLRTATFAAIPESIKKDSTIEQCTECVGHWSAAWTELVGFRQHVHTGLLFVEPQNNTDILTRFDDCMTNLKGIRDACGAIVTLKQCPQLLEDIKLLVLPGDLGGSVAQIRTWKKETERMTKVIENSADAARKVAAAAVGGEGAAAAVAEAARTENVRLTSELGACQTKLVASEDLVKDTQAKVSASEDLVKALEGANGRLEALVAASDKEISKLTTHITDGRTSARPVDVADRVETLLVELNNLMPGHLSARVPQPLIVQISTEIVAAFTGYEIKDVIRRLVSQLESAVHPRVSSGLISTWLDELDRTTRDGHEETRERTSAEHEIARLRGEAV